jgi:hypothetical protein
MAGPKQTSDGAGDCCVGTAGISIPPSAPQLAMAVKATYKNFRKLVAYVLTDDAALAIQMVKQLGYSGLEWEADLVTLPPPSE